MIKNKISIIIFFLGIIIFFMNLQYISNYYLNIALFLLSIFLIFAIVIYQILSLKNYTFILFEIFLIFFLLHLIYQLGYFGLRGSDSYLDYNLMKIILNDHHFSLGTDMLNGWPLLHIFSSIISMVIKIEPLIIAKFIPSFISSLIVIPLYLYIYMIYKNEKIALLTCLIFATIPQFESFTALLVRETYAIFFFIFFIYLLYVSKQRENLRLKFLVIILVPVVVLSHHFTSFMLIIFLTIYLINSKLIPFIFRKTKNEKIVKKDITNFYLILLFTIFFYLL